MSAYDLRRAGDVLVSKGTDGFVAGFRGNGAEFVDLSDDADDIS